MAEITGRGNGRWLIGCVADNNWRFLDQSLALVRSLRWFGGDAAQSDFLVCVVDSAKPAYIREMSRYGAQVRIVPTYNREYPDLSHYDHILLLDCDTLVVQNPLTPLTGDHLQAKMVPRRSIPHELFEKLFRLFDLPIPERNQEYSVSKELSIPYFNTGVVCLHKAQLPNLVPAWIKFVDRLIERIELIAEREWFIEQVALSLALAATGSEFGVLGNDMNFQIHVFPGEVYEPRLEGIDPRIVHYHRGVTARDEIARSAYPLVSARIDMFNDRVREEAGDLRLVPANDRIAGPGTTFSSSTSAAATDASWSAAPSGGPITTTLALMCYRSSCAMRPGGPISVTALA